MKRNRLLVVGLMMIAELLGSCSSSPRHPNSVNPPNIILILADDLGYGDLSSYGSEIPTPHIDQIGADGIRFSDFYVTAPRCTPSRYSLLTGSYPNRSLHGLDRVIMPKHKDRRFDKSEKIIPEYLKKFGYRTAIFGKWHLGSDSPSDFPQGHGFDEFVGHTAGCIDYFRHSYTSLEKSWYHQDKPIEEEGYATALITDHVLNFIDKGKKNSHPFFIYLAYNAPHYGKSLPQDTLNQHTISLKEGVYMGKPFVNSLQAPVRNLAKLEQVENIYRRYYAAMVVSMDENIGRLISHLKEEGRYENTLIWFVSDNGAYSKKYFGHGSNGVLKGEKGQVYEGGIRVPSLICWKDKIEPNQVSTQISSTLDILPTLAGIVGFSDDLSQNKHIDGLDIGSAVFKGKEIERSIFWEYSPASQAAFRKGNWKMVNRKELYDLQTDKGETLDKASQYPEMLKELNRLHELKLREVTK